MFSFQVPQIGGANGLLQNPQQSVNNTQNAQVKVIGNYQYDFRHCLGEGAYGKVFEGIDKRNNQKVAIKKLDIRQFQNDTYLRNSIISEIEILKRFNHKNIVKFIDLITTTRSFYIITEYCKDGDLRLLIQSKKITEAQALRIIRDIIEGFKELVKHNVTHRDLKPANILIHDGVFKIADFGFAKYVDYSSAQMLRSCVGSPLYMAPQILARKAYGLKSDVWSIGVIFHEMLFYDVPWKARDEKELLNNITKNPFKLRKNAKLQSLSENILIRTLVNEEKDRVSWEELFKMFTSYDSANLFNPFPNTNNKENNLPTKSTIPIVPPPAQVLNQPTNNINFNNINNKLKKSIFDNQVIGQRQPTQIVRQHSGIDPKRLFISINQKRLDISFRHFVCIDLFAKIRKNTTFMDNSSLIYEKLLMSLCAWVNADINSLIVELQEHEQSNQDSFTNSKELRALSNTLKRENEFYKQFTEDLMSNLKSTNTIEYLKTDKDVSYLLATPNSMREFTDQERPRSENTSLQLSNVISTEILNFTKQAINNKVQQQQYYSNVIQNDLEQYRQQIVSAEYLQDIVEIKKKINRGEMVQFDQYHLLKSEIACVQVHLDRAMGRVSKFSFPF